MELGEAHHLIFEPNVFRPCSVSSPFFIPADFIPADPGAVVGSKKVLDYTASSPSWGRECWRFPSAMNIVDVIFDAFTPVSGNSE